MKSFERLSHLFNYYSRFNPIAASYAHPSFSQYGEDRIVEAELPRNRGWYVEVGAYHPFRFSNSYLFYSKGWSGVLVEPQSSNCSLLRRFRPRDTIIEAAVSDKNGHVFFQKNEMDTTSKIATTEVNNENLVRLPCYTLESIFGKTQTPEDFEFLSIDCEGHDLTVLRSNNWAVYRPKVIAVEDLVTNDVTDIDILLDENSYKLIGRCDQTKIFKTND
jgi:FkbM family methyltransferase